MEAVEDIQGGLEYYIYFAARDQEQKRNEKNTEESAMGGYTESLSSDLEGLLPMKCT